MRPAILLLLVAAAAAGCMGGSDASVERTELAKAVLQPDDLPPAWIRFDEGRQGVLERLRGNRADEARFGRLAGWKARYRKPGTAATRGPLVLDSRVDLFEDAGGAEEELAALRAEPPLGAPVEGPSPRIGEETVILTLVEGTGIPKTRFWLVAWRQANVTGSVLGNGFANGFPLEQVVALARKQERRIAALVG